MLAMILVVLLAFVLALAVLVYVAYPYRGAETPYAPRVGRTMRRGVESLPTLVAPLAETSEERHQVYAGR